METVRQPLSKTDILSAGGVLTEIDPLRPSVRANNAPPEDKHEWVLTNQLDGEASDQVLSDTPHCLNAHGILSNSPLPISGRKSNRLSPVNRAYEHLLNGAQSREISEAS